MIFELPALVIEFEFSSTVLFKICFSADPVSEDVLEQFGTFLLVFIDIIGNFGNWGCSKGNFFIDEVTKGCFEATIEKRK